MKERPKVNSEGQKELDKAQAQFETFHEQVKALTSDSVISAPKAAQTPEHQISQKAINNAPDVYLKPSRSLSSKEKFNERFRADYDFAKEFVQFVAYNNEISGDNIEMWTKPFPGVDAEYWEIPSNRPVWGPRYVAEQIKKCSYRRLKMDEGVTTKTDGYGKYYGNLVADTLIQRLDAQPVSSRKSIFMGASGF